MMDSLKQSLGSWKVHRKARFEDPADLARLDQQVAHMQTLLADAGVNPSDEQQGMALIAGSLAVFNAAVQWMHMHEGNPDLPPEEMSCIMAFLQEATQCTQETVYRKHSQKDIPPQCHCTGGH